MDSGSGVGAGAGAGAGAGGSGGSGSGGGGGGLAAIGMVCCQDVTLLAHFPGTVLQL